MEKENKEEIEKNDEMQEDGTQEIIEVNIEEHRKEEVENIVEIEKKENTDETVKIENNVEAEIEENTQTKTKGINLWLLLIPIVLIVLVLIYIFTDLLKTDEQNFAKYMYITSKNIENLKSVELEKYYDKTKYTSNGEMSLIADGEDIKVQFTGKTDVESRLKETNIITDYGSEKIEINYKQDNENYAIKIDELYDKYIAIENNNLKELANLLGINSEEIPNEINFEEYKFTDEELEDIKQRYIKIIKSNINKENYSREKSNDCTIYKLSLTNKEFKNIKIKLLQELKKDNVILERYVLFEELNGNKIEKEDLRKEIELKIKELEESMSEQDKEAIVISLYAKLNKCEKIEIKLSEEILVIETDSDYLKIENEKEDNNFHFEIHKEEFAKELNYNIQIENQTYDFDINLKYSDLLKNTIKEEYEVDLNLNNENINLNYTNTTSQDENLIINSLQNSECEILNNLNKSQINELIYKIYNNMVNL